MGERECFPQAREIEWDPEAEFDENDTQQVTETSAASLTPEEKLEHIFDWLSGHLRAAADSPNLEKLASDCAAKILPLFCDLLRSNEAAEGALRPAFGELTILAQRGDRAGFVAALTVLFRRPREAWDRLTKARAPAVERHTALVDGDLGQREAQPAAAAFDGGREQSAPKDGVKNEDRPRAPLVELAEPGGPVKVTEWESALASAHEALVLDEDENLILNDGMGDVGKAARGTLPWAILRVLREKQGCLLDVADLAKSIDLVTTQYEANRDAEKEDRIPDAGRLDGDERYEGTQRIPRAKPRQPRLYSELEPDEIIERVQSNLRKTGTEPRARRWRSRWIHWDRKAKTVIFEYRP